MKPSKHSLEYIDETLNAVHHAVDGRPNRALDLRVERIFNWSEIHDDHLDRFPDSAARYTSSLDACRKLMMELWPQGDWKLITAADRHGASVYDSEIKGPIKSIGSPLGMPSVELSILYVLLTMAYLTKRDAT